MVVFLLTVCVRGLSSSSRTSCHPAAADGLQRKLAQRAGAFFWSNGGSKWRQWIVGEPVPAQPRRFPRKLPTRLGEIPPNPNAYRPAIKTLTAGESCVAFSPPSL